MPNRAYNLLHGPVPVKESKSDIVHIAKGYVGKTNGLRALWFGCARRMKIIMVGYEKTDGPVTCKSCKNSHMFKMAS